MKRNAQRGKTIMRMRAFQGKWPTVRMAFNGGSAGSLQWSGFRENPTNILTSVTRDRIFRANRQSRGEM